MITPDYRGGNIVNLMSSILASRGGRCHHQPLRMLPSKEIASSKNIVLLVIDGLGQQFLEGAGRSSALSRYCRGKITSVFPSTTASAVTTLMSGLTPLEHGIPGWFTYLKEVGTVAAVLPFCPRSSHHSFGIDVARHIFQYKIVFDCIKAKPFLVLPHWIVSSDYTVAHMGKASRIAFLRKSGSPQEMAGLFAGVHRAIRFRGKTFVYAYWPEFDSVCHVYGPDSRQAVLHFQKIDALLGRFFSSLKGTDTTVIVTADHGQIQTPAAHAVLLKDHPVLQDCLVLPLCGEARAAYCYVHPEKTRVFEQYVRSRLKKYCTLYRSEEIIRKGWFGHAGSRNRGRAKEKINPHLRDRIGHYVLLMKHDYIIKDSLAGMNEKPFRGNHGGLSAQEMWVPLIVFRTT